jgi:hypothetical protein
MAVFDQQKTTYTDTTNDVRVVADVINLIDPVDTPLLVALGGFDAAGSKLALRGNGYKLEWIEDAYADLTTTANQGTTITTNATTLTVTDASIFQPGHIILIDAEYIWVSAVDVTNNTITVTRTYGGTNATHVTTSAVEIVGMARLEGADAAYGPVVDITAPYNYTQIFQKALNISGSAMAIDKYGYDDEFAYQANKGIPELSRLIEKQLFHGVRAAGSATTPRGFGGLGTFVTANSVNAGGAIAKSHIDSLAEKVLLAGGSPDLFVCSPSVANDLRGLLDSSSFVNLTLENSVLGMMPITGIRTQYGTLKIVESRWAPVARAYVLDSRKVGLYTLRPFGWKELGLTGDGRKGELVGEFSLAVANDAAHGYIYGITS